MANRPLTTRSLRPFKLSAVTPTLTLQVFGRMVLQLFKVDCCWPEGTGPYGTSSIAGSVDGIVHRRKEEQPADCTGIKGQPDCNECAPSISTAFCTALESHIVYSWPVPLTT